MLSKNSLTRFENYSCEALRFENDEVDFRRNKRKENLASVFI